MRKLKSLGLCLAVLILTIIPFKIAQAQEASKKLNMTVNESSSSLLLYGGERTRAAVVVWYLEELDISYQYQDYQSYIPASFRKENSMPSPSFRNLLQSKGTLKAGMLRILVKT